MSDSALKNLRNRYGFNLIALFGLVFLGIFLFARIYSFYLEFIKHEFEGNALFGELLFVVYNFSAIAGIITIIAVSVLIFEFSLDIKIKSEKFINSKTFPWVQGVGIVSFFTPAIVAGLICF